MVPVAIWHQWRLPHGTIGVCHMAPSECLKIIEKVKFLSVDLHRSCVPYGTNGVCHMAPTECAIWHPSERAVWQPGETWWPVRGVGVVSFWLNRHATHCCATCENRPGMHGPRCDEQHFDAGEGTGSDGRELAEEEGGTAGVGVDVVTG